MKDAEKAVRTVMAGLGGTPGAGLEARVAERLQRRMAERGVLGKARFDGRRWAAFASAAGAVVFAAMLLVVRTTPPQGERHGVKRGAEATGKQAPVSGVEVGVASGTADPASVLRESATARRRGGRRGSGALEMVRLARAASGASRKSVEEASVSFPAPPMPLTRQERLLLRVANRGGPEEVARLGSFAGGLRDAEETARFQEFFGRPESVEETVHRISQGESR